MLASTPETNVGGKRFNPLDQLDRVIETLTPTTTPEIIGDLTAIRDNYRSMSSVLEGIFRHSMVQSAVLDAPNLATPKVPRKPREPSARSLGQRRRRRREALARSNAAGGSLASVIISILLRPECMKGLRLADVSKVIRDEGLYTTHGHLDDEIYDTMRTLYRRGRIVKTKDRKYVCETYAGVMSV